jgi:hypothetical protein
VNIHIFVALPPRELPHTFDAGWDAAQGAQGNIPFDRIYAEDLRAGLTGPIESARSFDRILFAGLFQRPDRLDRLQKMSIEELASIHEGIPPRVIARHRASPFYPVQVPDRIGVKDRKYLDHTGLQVHRSIADLMRYAALNQGVDFLASFNGLIALVPKGETTS